MAPTTTTTTTDAHAGPLVSVVIPVHNRAVLLNEALASLRAQTYGRWEAIAVDDASTDGSAAVVAGHARADARVRLIPRTGDVGGACAARNQGVAASAGELVVFLDSDDLLSPHCLAQRVRAMAAHPGLDFGVFPGRVFRTAAGDTPLLWNVDLPHESDVDRYLRRDIPWQTSAPVWRRAALDRVGPWDERALSGQDWEFHLRALIAGLAYRRFGPPEFAPDYEWRMPEPERESIGNRAAQPEHLRHRAVMVERVARALLDRGPLPARRRDLLVGQFFAVASSLSFKRARPEGLALWRRCRELRLVTARQHLEGKLYLRFLHRRGFRERTTAYLRRRWPAETQLGRSTTHLNAPLRAAPDAPPAISVVMCVSGDAPHLDAAVDSILRQTLADLELVVVDVRPTGHRPLELLQRLTEQDPRVRLLTRPQLSPSQALNEAVDLARADLVARMDADGVALPQRLEKQVAHMRAHPDCACVGSRVIEVDGLGAETGVSDHALTHDAIDRNLLAGAEAIVPAAAVLRREAVRRVGGWRDALRVARDLDLFLRLGESGTLANLADPLLKRRRAVERPGGTGYDGGAGEAARVVAEALARRRDKPPLPSEPAGAPAGHADAARAVENAAGARKM